MKAFFYWCLESDSNRHERKAHEILSLGCLPIPPSRRVGCFYHTRIIFVNLQKQKRLFQQVLSDIQILYQSNRTFIIIGVKVKEKPG